MENRDISDIFGGFWKGRRVFLTGHTGFKGAWLSLWLEQLGAEVHAFALPPEPGRTLFGTARVADAVKRSTFGDIRDPAALRPAMEAAAPEVVIHLAAQSLVRRSYRDPVATWDTNVLGTIQVMEAARRLGSVRSMVLITTDKCYENREWPWGYREDDAFGGHDPYSSSKGAAEIAISSWRRSFFSAPGSAGVASARAGNVIGGGDWSEDRIVCDLVRAQERGEPLVLRNPGATRPWQYVLEPLGGYLHLARRLFEHGARDAEGWNFGPSDESAITVGDLARQLTRHWGRGQVVENPDPNAPHEAGWLKLDCSKARQRLGWRWLWDIDRTLEETASWYRSFAEGRPARELCLAQIERYQEDAAASKLPWTCTRTPGSVRAA